MGIITLAGAARDGTLVGGSHIVFPGLGHVTRRGAAYEWVPLPWSSKP